MIQSRNVRITECSADISDVRSSRDNSRKASFSTSEGAFSAEIFFRKSSISTFLPSSSPNSFLMALSCSRRKYSRCALSMDSFVSDLIFWRSSNTSTWRISWRETNCRRASTSSVAKTSYLSAVGRSRVDAMISMRAMGLSMLSIVDLSSPVGWVSRENALEACSRRCMILASNSLVCGALSSNNRVRATKKGSV